MVAKFEKYWGDFEKVNKLMWIAVLLDPRCKSNMLRLCMSILLGDERAMFFSKECELVFRRLYLEYQGSQDELSSPPDVRAPVSKDPLFSRLYAGSSSIEAQISRSEIDVYLHDAVEEYSENLDILLWWKLNSHKYPIISRIAKDVLTIPITTVPSESAFSTGGRVIDEYRTSLLPKTVEALICGQSWILSETPRLLDPLDTLDRLKDYATIDEEIACGGDGDRDDNLEAIDL